MNAGEFALANYRLTFNVMLYCFNSMWLIEAESNDSCNFMGINYPSHHQDHYKVFS
jgi:hypothetical protein